MGDDPDALARNLQDRFPHAEIVDGDHGLEDTVAAVVGLVERPGSGFDLPLDIRGTAFQDRVWQALREVPAGSTVSYADVARRIGAPGSSRASPRRAAPTPSYTQSPATGWCGQTATRIIPIWQA